MKELIKALDNLPLIGKIILCIPAVAIIWWVYRICKSLLKQETVHVVLAAVLLVVGIPFMWLVDLICILLYGKVFWID